MDRRRALLWILLCLASLVVCQDAANASDGSYPYDPVLLHRPNFARSLPIQVLLSGITLTLTSVLVFHLVFTGQYHWPLAPVNYVLQMAAVTTLLVSCIATLHVVLGTTVESSKRWPYMLDYIAVDIPPLDDKSGWQTGELVAWLLMDAATSGLIQITHIQFLTLLFPSGLERRLIFCLLGPLAVVSSIMHVLRISDNTQVVKVASAIQNICNATLSLLFTASLFLWGCLVNRRGAWRTDGGTAAFGVGALTLALVSTALNFLYIPSRDQYPWMPGLMWSVVLWQSFLGWWWWVGAGMGVGEVEQLLRREEKRRLRVAKRLVRNERARTFWKGMTGAFSSGRQQRPQMHEHEGTDSSSDSSGTEGAARRTRATGGEQQRRVHRVASRQTDTSSRSGTTVSSGLVSRFVNQYRAGRYLYGWYLGLRHAHLKAARDQAVERVERINQAYGPEAQDGGQGAFGWGLGSFGIRSHQRRKATAQTAYEMDEFESGDEHLQKRSGREANEVEGVQGESEIRPRKVVRRATSNAHQANNGLDSDNHRPTSVWWWGPLQRWRLQDSTDYRS